MFFKKLCLTAFLFYLSMTSQGIKSGQTPDEPAAVFDFFGEDGTEEAQSDSLTEPAGTHRSSADLAAGLAAFGLEVPDEIVRSADESYQSYPEIYDSYLEYDPAFEYRMLLSSWGWGEYDDDWNWIPTSDQVYAFDCEVFDMSCMYTDFMKGVIAISGGEFEITDIVENTDGVDYDQGTGTQVLSFRYNGVPYTYEAEFYGDWLDCGVIGFMNEVFEAEGNSKRLLATGDGGQGCILFYNTPDWGEALAAETGLDLEPYFY